MQFVPNPPRNFQTTDYIKGELWSINLYVREAVRFVLRFF
jgi:hypothetical protein